MDMQGAIIILGATGAAMTRDELAGIRGCVFLTRDRVPADILNQIASVAGLENMDVASVDPDAGVDTVTKRLSDGFVSAAARLKHTAERNDGSVAGDCAYELALERVADALIEAAESLGANERH